MWPSASRYPAEGGAGKPKVILTYTYMLIYILILFFFFFLFFLAAYATMLGTLMMHLQRTCMHAGGSAGVCVGVSWCVCVCELVALPKCILLLAVCI